MPTILLVDDDQSVRAAVEDWLCAAGFSVIAAPETAAGLRELEAHPEVDLCLVDLVMPSDVPDGRFFLSAVRSRKPNMPVIRIRCKIAGSSGRLSPSLGIGP